MEYQRKCVIIFLLLTLSIYISAEHIIDVELENLEKDHPWTGIRSVYRQNASRGGSLHLYETDAIIVKLCPDGPMTVSVENVSYSNDGTSDTLQVLENRNVLGTFTTYQQSNWGEYWNVFLSSGPLGIFYADAQPINLTLSVTYADCFGIELDKIVLKVNKSVDQSVFICGYELIEGPKKSECMPTKSNDTVVIHASSTLQTTTLTSATVERQTTISTAKVVTESSSTMQPIVTTKQDNVVSSTAVSSTTNQQRKVYEVMVKQKSSRTKCLDRKNINIEFYVPTIVGTTIISRKDNAFETSSDERSRHENDDNKCDNVIWQLGHPDNSGKEFSNAIPNGDVEFTIVEEKAEAKKFPGVIQTDKTHKIVVRYTLGYTKQLESGSSVFFTLGLARLNKNINIGVQYYHRGKKDTKIYTHEFSPKLSVMRLVIPARTISPSLENQIHIYFPNASDVPIEIDFMRLDYILNETRSRNVLLHEDNVYRIRGAQYVRKPKVNDMSDEGMNVTIGKDTTSDIEKLVIYHRQNSKGKYSAILAIDENGEFSPYRENQQGPKTEKEMVDVSALIFAGVDGTGKTTANPISRLEINPSTMNINVTYEDGSTLNLLVRSTTAGTQIVVNEARFPGSVNSSLSFVSTYVSEYASSVNQMIVDGLKNVHVLSEEINNISGSTFTFQKTSQGRPNKTGQVIEVRF
ncbi:hypothetical protein ACJMK2_034786 [Sinanodonta woodiana]|uniref:Uncharacterized protein n=1 Tax=Sinanodonta woodiana TaxID=1069815 RepID=A0ABD3WWU0_SINWO